MESQLTLYARPFADLAKGFPVNVFIGVRLALQYDTLAAALAKYIARLEDGSPVSPVGELIDVMVEEVEAATSNQPNSESPADVDV